MMANAARNLAELAIIRVSPTSVAVLGGTGGNDGGTARAELVSSSPLALSLARTSPISSDARSSFLFARA
jgi:NAD(P)H-hydrate repair Nnr-like enzyme with NAD(P)H-hydrate epimerase domain